MISKILNNLKATPEITGARHAGGKRFIYPIQFHWFFDIWDHIQYGGDTRPGIFLGGNNERMPTERTGMRLGRIICVAIRTMDYICHKGRYIMEPPRRKYK